MAQLIGYAVITILCIRGLAAFAEDAGLDTEV